MATRLGPNKQVHFGGYWEDGTPKLIDGQGHVLPKGTTWVVKGNGVTIVDPKGQPVQHRTDAGIVSTPVTDITQLPAGSYDPTLLTNTQQAGLNNLYGHQDFTTQWDGYKVDPVTGQLVRPGDLSTAGRGVQDYFTNLDRENENYGTATSDLQHRYQVMGNNQLQAINAAGALQGGALAQALAKRTANEQHDQSGLDTTHNRSLADMLTGTTRGHADADQAVGRSDQSLAQYQAGSLASATAQSNQSGAFVDNPNYQTHNGVIYQVMGDGSRKPVGRAGGFTRTPVKPRKSKPSPFFADPSMINPSWI